MIARWISALDGPKSLRGAGSKALITLTGDDPGSFGGGVKAVLLHQLGWPATPSSRKGISGTLYWPPDS